MRNSFLAKIKNYTDAQSVFNMKWDVRSDCSITMKPAGVQCSEGKPVLIYSLASN
jgi:hypothetical protein